MALIMAKNEEDEFQYIVRIAATDIDGNIPVRYALTQIKGVGNSIAKLVAQRAGVNPFVKIGKLPDKDIKQLDETVTSIPEWSPVWMRNRNEENSVLSRYSPRKEPASPRTAHPRQQTHGTYRRRVKTTIEEVRLDNGRSKVSEKEV